MLLRLYFIRCTQHKKSVGHTTIPPRGTGMPKKEMEARPRHTSRYSMNIAASLLCKLPVFAVASANIMYIIEQQKLSGSFLTFAKIVIIVKL